MGNAASEPRDSTEPFLLNENLVTQVYEGDEDSSETAAWLSEILNEKDEYIQTKKGLLNRDVLEKYVQDIGTFSVTECFDCGIYDPKPANVVQ